MSDKGITVRQLRELLADLDQDSEVRCLWDGHARTGVRFVWQCAAGVILAGEGDPVYGRDERPSWAPTIEQEMYWHTPQSDDEE